MKHFLCKFYFLAVCCLFAVSTETSNPGVGLNLDAANFPYHNGSGLRADLRYNNIVKQRRKRCRRSNELFLGCAFFSPLASFIGSRFIDLTQHDKFHSVTKKKNHRWMLPRPMPNGREAKRNKLTRLEREQSQGQHDNNELLRKAIQNLASIIDLSDNPCTENDLPSTQSESQPQLKCIPTTVHIIGTGLTPTLMSLPLSTLLLLSKADVVLYDSLGLSRDDICKVVPKHCEVICVGKRGDSKKSWKQNDIDELILQMALENMSSESTSSSTSSSTSISSNLNRENQNHSLHSSKCIIRLKGGDPFLFGRTRTEIESLRSNNIPYTYTPSISSCIAGPHLGGIPLTDTSLDCQSFGVWSGTDAFGRSIGMGNNDGDESGFTRDGLCVDTLVFLMIGRLDKLEGLCNALIQSGSRDGDMVDGGNRRKWAANTTCAVIQNAGGRKMSKGKVPESYCSTMDERPIQKVWRSTLENIISDIRKEDDTIASVSPAVFIVGATCELNLLAD